MRQHSKIIVYGLIFLLSGCSSIRETYVDTKTFKVKTKINFHKRQDEKRRELMDQCSRTWVYGVLDSQTDLKIIQYHKAFQFDMISKPALIIGSTNTNDTIRVLAYKYNENLSVNEFIKVKTDSTIDLNNKWTIGLIKRDLPIFLSKKKIEDKYFCDIKKTYIVTIKK